jgi:[ribosomal protein S5]-alanine N-acetyltransferase
MLRAASITLRPVRQDDLEELYARHLDIANRGEFFPVNVLSESEFRRRFQDGGFWTKESGMLLIVNGGGRIVGHVEFFRTVSYLDELELSYQIYETAERGHGQMTEAVNLLVSYLFAQRKINRIRLVIHPGNLASQRVAEKCGFVCEGTARGAWFHRGSNHDVHIYAILRHEVTLA